MIEIQHLKFNYITFNKTSGLKGSLKDLFKRQQKTFNVYRDLNLNVQDGEMLGLMGPNGAGKTTLIKLLTGVIEPAGGKIDIDGTTPSTKSNSFLKQIGVLFGQKSQLSWDLPATDTFDLIAKIYNLAPSDYKNRLNELTTMLNVTDFVNRPVRKLSLGQRMRCELICALIHSPKYLFLDEPTLGLDITTQHAIYTFLKEENQRYGTTIIITSHSLQDIERLADRVVVMVKGNFVYDGTTTALPVNVSEHQSFAIQLDRGDGAANNIVVPANEVASRVAKIGFEHIISVTRVGMSFEDFILQLYKSGVKS